jgi:hypothetical protein
MSILSRLFPAKQESPTPRRRHHLLGSPYHIIVVPDATIAFIDHVTSSSVGRLVDLIAHHSVNLEDMRGMEDSEFFLLWDTGAHPHPEAEPDAPPMQWLIAQVNVYTREITNLFWPKALMRRFLYDPRCRYPAFHEFSLAKRLAGVDDSVAAHEDEYDEYVDEFTAAAQDALLSNEGAKRTRTVVFDLHCIDAITDEATVTPLGKSTAADWRDHVDDMLNRAKALARNTRSAHLYVLLSEKRRAMLADFDVSGGQV